MGASKPIPFKKNSHETSLENEYQLHITVAICIAVFHVSEPQFIPL